METFFKILVSIVCIGGLMILASEEDKAVREYETAIDKFEREKKKYIREIESIRNKSSLNIEFQKHIKLHFESFTWANEYYDKLTQGRNLLTKILEEKKALNDLLEKGKLSTSDLEKTRKSISDYENYIQVLKKKNIQASRSVKELNHQTHLLKLYIRDNFGSKGQNWYAKLESKKYNTPQKLDQKIIANKIE